MPNTKVFSFYYDEQIRRYILQFMRIFSLIKIQSGPDENGVVTQSSVPVRYGDTNRMVEHIRRKNSPNTILPANIMSVWVSNLQQDDNRRLNPYHVGKINIDEREFDGENYTSEVGRNYSIERYMPVPYTLTLQLDIWTTNTTTKLQILEQILTIFNPTIQIQQNDNLLDWSTMVDVKLSNINWTNRTIGSQLDTDTMKDIASLTFDLGIWINPPAKVKRKKLIEQIVTTVYDMAEMPDEDIDKFQLDPIKNCFDPLTQIIVTPKNHKIKIGVEEAGPTQLYLLTDGGDVDESLSWTELFKLYGEFQEGSTFITLKTAGEDIEDDDEGDIIGFVEFTSKDHILKFNVDVDTLPSTISSGPITKIINPIKTYPGNNLPNSAIGQRYLLLNDIPVNTGLNPWGSVNASKNDIIEYDGTNWFISFDASEEEPDQYVESLSSYQHYKFTGDEWVHTYFGEYSPGYWRITMQSS